MKSVSFGVLIAFIFFCITLHVYGQDSIPISINEFSYFENEREYDLIEFTITNNRQDDYLIWISEDNIVGVSDTLLIVNYFLVHKGDFSFLDLVFSKSLQPLDVHIYMNFIKKIGYKEHFSFIFLVQKERKSEILTFFKEHVVILDKRKIFDFLQFKDITIKYFSKDHIVLFR